MNENCQSFCTGYANVVRDFWSLATFVEACSLLAKDLGQYKSWVKTKIFFDAPADWAKEAVRDASASACAFC